ncbi:hypothetical protein chiPu_0029219, partial [Chiloscyllium punctatum]|nr:hypothetical protein [Chiloscyllium punctatum]
MDADGVIRTDLALCSDPASPGGSDLEDPTAVPCGEEQTVPSIFPEIIADGTDTNSIDVGAGDPNGVSSASTLAVPS